MVSHTMPQYTGMDANAFARMAPNPSDLIMDGVYWVSPWKPDMDTRVRKTCCRMRGCFTVFQISDREIWI